MKYFVGRPAISGSLGGYTMVTLFALKLRAGYCVRTAAEVIMRHPLASMDRGETARRNQRRLPGGAWPWGVVRLGAGWVTFWGPEAERSQPSGCCGLGSARSP